jgi:hypothetical protein
MVRHRRLFLALALGALFSLTGREANAGNLTITVSWTGGSLSVDFTGPQAVVGGSANSFAIDPGLLNTAIAASGYQFSELGGSSNNPGNPLGAVVRLTGTAFLNGTVAPPSAITVTASQTEFTSPSGLGTLGTRSTANFTLAQAGSTMTSNASLDATTTPDLMYTPPGGSLSNSIGASGSPSGYTLSAAVVINLVGPSGFGGVADQFTNNVAFAAVVPEPASLVMMLTGMPLPLVVMGLLRRRRAAAA